MNTIPPLSINRRKSVCTALGATAFANLLPFGRAQAAESVTYLFPAPPILPAFGPLQLAKGRGYFEKEGLDMKWCAKPPRSAAAVSTWPSRSAPAMHRSGYRCRRSDPGAWQRCAGEDCMRVRRSAVSCSWWCGRIPALPNLPISKARPYGHVFPGHDLLCAARAARKRRPVAERRGHPGSGTDRRLAIRGRRQIGGHGRCAGLDSAGGRCRSEGRNPADRRVLPAHGPGNRHVG